MRPNDMLYTRILVTAASLVCFHAGRTTAVDPGGIDKTTDDEFNFGDQEAQSGAFGGMAAEDDFIPALLDMVQDDFGQCGLDVSAYLGADGTGDPAAAMEILELSRPCTVKEQDSLRQAFLNFEDCSGYDELLLNEDMYGALIGALTKCFNSMSALDMATLSVPEDCAIAVLGNHPLGQALRDALLHPGTTGDCFSKLADEVPQCSVNLWPFPVDGKLIKMGACIESKIEVMLLEQCHEGLGELKTCLPATISSTNCGTYKAKCGESDSYFTTFLMTMPESLQGMPLPDSCVEQAASTGLSKAVEKYEAFRTTCASEGKALWERLEEPQNDPKDPKLQTFAQFLLKDGNSDQIQNEGSSAGEGNDNNIGDNVEEEQPVLQSSGSEVASVDFSQVAEGDEQSSGPSFGVGVLTGVLLVLVGYGAVILLMKRYRKPTSGPAFVELSTNVGNDLSFA